MKSIDRIKQLTEHGIFVSDNGSSGRIPEKNRIIAIFSDGKEYINTDIENIEARLQRNPALYQKMLDILRLEGVDPDKFKKRFGGGIDLQSHYIFTNEGRNYSFTLPTIWELEHYKYLESKTK